MTLLPLLLMVSAFSLLNVLQLSFVGGLPTPERSIGVNLEAAKKGTAKAAPKTFTMTGIFKQVAESTTGYGELKDKDALERRKLVKEILNAYWDVVGDGLKADADVKLNGYLSLRVNKKPAVKKGTVVKVAGKEYKSKGKPAQTKLSVSPLKNLLVKVGIVKK